MSNSSSYLAPVLMAGAMMAEPAREKRTAIGAIDFSSKKAPVPKGCKIYWFNNLGAFSTEQMRYTDIVFTCIAINDKNAMRKYSAWLEKSAALAIDHKRAEDHPVLKRLIEEIRHDDRGNISAFNRTHNRHNRGR